MLVPFFRVGDTGPEVVTAATLSAEQLRFGLCFWDRLAWPSIPYFQSNDNADVDFLTSAGVLLRPEVALRPNLRSAGTGLAESYLHAFQTLEEKEPGRWSLSTETAFDIRTFLGDRVEPDRGITVSLHRAIPVPTGDAPLHDLLEFRQKREPELLALRGELDDYKRLITSSTDRAEAFATQTDKIDAACSDLFAVIRERRLPVRISDVSMTLEVNEKNVVDIVDAISKAAHNLNLAGVQEFLTSMGLIGLSAIKIQATFGTRSKAGSLKKSPFRYVYHLHEEIDWV